MLTVENLTSYYSNIKILKNLSFNLKKGKVLCLLGRNGAGKTTTLKSLMGLVDKTEGQIIFNDEKISGISAHLIPQKGIGYVPQGRRLFSELTVEENLEIGLLTRKKGKNTKNKIKNALIVVVKHNATRCIAFQMTFESKLGFWLSVEENSEL